VETDGIEGVAGGGGRWTGGGGAGGTGGTVTGGGGGTATGGGGSGTGVVTGGGGGTGTGSVGVVTVGIGGTAPTASPADTPVEAQTSRAKATVRRGIEPITEMRASSFR
jgi:hypothetical protein